MYNSVYSCFARGICTIFCYFCTMFVTLLLCSGICTFVALLWNLYDSFVLILCSYFSQTKVWSLSMKLLWFCIYKHGLPRHIEMMPPPIPSNLPPMPSNLPLHAFKLLYWGRIRISNGTSTLECPLKREHPFWKGQLSWLTLIEQFPLKSIRHNCEACQSAMCEVAESIMALVGAKQ